ncbi:MAG TPA: hypothetical protein VE035_17930, partial [Puia sp.]|nr:hypothetical protein [Puia sp.]
MSANKKNASFLFPGGMIATGTIFAALVLFPAFIHAQGRPDSAARQAQMRATEADHRNMMEQLHIDSIRRGADGNNP